MPEPFYNKTLKVWQMNIVDNVYGSTKKEAKERGERRLSLYRQMLKAEFNGWLIRFERKNESV